MPVLTNLIPLDINPDFNAARLMHRCTQPKRKRFVIGTTRTKKGPRYSLQRGPEGNGHRRLLEGVLPVGYLLSNQCSRTFCFHEAAIAPAFHSRQLRGELRLQAIKM